MSDPLTALLAFALTALVLWVFFRPGRGLFWQWRQARQMTERVQCEDALKHIYHCDTRHERVTVESIAGVLGLSPDETAALIERMQERGLIRVEGDRMALTDDGHAYALHMVRAHRLMERYLADETGIAETDWHRHADREEHRLSREDIAALETHLRHPTYDPHGDPIPTAGGELPSAKGVPLTDMKPGETVMIVHLEDEPETVFAQLVAEGLYPGMEVRLQDVSNDRVRFWSDEDEHVLAPLVAANITVEPVPAEQETESTQTAPLGSLKPGQKARIASLSGACRGLERRRFMDLGIVPGTLVEAEMTSAGGDPTAYRIRDTLIALRREQANLIRIVPEEATS